MNRRTITILVVAMLLSGAVGAFFFLRSDKRGGQQGIGQEQAPAISGTDVSKPIFQDGNSEEEITPAAERKEEPLQAIPDLDRPLIVKNNLNEDTLKQAAKDIANTVAALKEEASQFDLWIQLASLRKLIGDYLGARDALDFANQLAPKNSTGYSILANLYWLELKDYAKAEKNFLKVIENDPSDTDAYRNLSDLYRYSYMQKADQADDILLKGLQSNFDHRDLISYLAAYYRDTGNTAEARKYLEKLLAMTTDPQMRLQIQSDLHKL